VPPTRTIYYGQGQRLVYSVGIPKETVDGVARVLTRQGVFQNIQMHSVDVFVLSRADHTEVRFFVDENAWRNGGGPPAMPLFPFERPQQQQQNVALALFFEDTRK